jgi:Arc/MetJ family transcription regulator
VKSSTRTNIILNDELVAQAMVRAGVKTKKAAVEAALRAFVRKPDYSGLLALSGKGALADNYDPDECYQTHPVEPLLVSEPAAGSSARKVPQPPVSQRMQKKPG